MRNTASSATHTAWIHDSDQRLNAKPAAHYPRGVARHYSCELHQRTMSSHALDRYAHLGQSAPQTHNPSEVVMRIAQIAPLQVAVPPHGYGGTERVVYELTEALVQL